MSEDKPDAPRPRTPVAVAQVLKPYTAQELINELERRGRKPANGFCDCDYRDEWNDRAADEAGALLGRGDLREAVVWIARAHPAFERLPQLLARVLPTAGL